MKKKQIQIFILLSICFCFVNLNKNIQSYCANSFDVKLTERAYNECLLNNPTMLDYNNNLTRIILSMFFDVLSNGKDVFITATFTYQNTGNANISSIIYVLDIETILIKNRISSIIVYDSLGALQYNWNIIESLHFINVTLREPLIPQKLYTYSISYLLQNAIATHEIVKETNIFHWKIDHDEDVERFSLILSLPAKFVLIEELLIEPQPHYLSEDKRRIEWHNYYVKANDYQNWNIKFGFFEQTEFPFKTKIGLWIGITITTFLLGFIVGAVLTFFFTKSQLDIERGDIVENLLSKPEIDIIKIIKAENGTTTQSKICSTTNFSKAKVSYYLTELENKGIIKRERFGRLNRISIIDDLVEKAYFNSENEDNS